MFATAFSRIGERITANPGSGKKATYRLFVDDDGRRELRQSGEVDSYMEIQSYKDSVSIDYILSRFCAGDSSALSRVQGVYGDFTNMPTTLAELQQRVIDATALFDSLPLDVREQYNFSPSQFFAQLDSDKTKKIFDGLRDKASDVVDIVEPVTPPVSPQPVTPQPNVVKEVNPDA